MEQSGTEMIRITDKYHWKKILYLFIRYPSTLIFEVEILYILINN
uniref:Uncharacterized protein n=1 Tax=Arundo donax TaxID=35708 RepID=A0A0A8YT39_ARUDO